MVEALKGECSGGGSGGGGSGGGGGGSGGGGDGGCLPRFSKDSKYLLQTH